MFRKRGRSLRIELLESRDQPSFVVGPTYTAGSSPVAVAISDFEPDGKADIAVVNSVTKGTVTVLRGTGIGTFRNAFRAGAGNFPYDLAVGDCDSNGTPDFALTNYQVGAMTVVQSMGMGGFEAPDTYPAGPKPFFPAFGDLNQDGTLDIAISNNVGTGTVRTFFGTGNCDFNPGAEIPVGFDATGIALGDLNHDGALDMAVGNYHDGLVQILLGYGNGSFQGAIPYYADPSVIFISINDVNNDGEVDLVVLNGLPAGGVSILLGRGDGIFQPKLAMQLAEAGHPRALAVADFNRDGNVDVAIGGHDNSAVSIMLGNGDGYFQTPIVYPVPGGPRDIAAADFNADGYTDLVVAIPTAGVTVLMNSGNWLPAPLPPTRPIDGNDLRPNGVGNSATSFRLEVRDRSTTPSSVDFTNATNPLTPVRFYRLAASRMSVGVDWFGVLSGA